MTAAWTPPPPRTIARPDIDALPAEHYQAGIWFLPSHKRPTRAEACIKACMAAGMATPAALVMDGTHYGFPLPKPWERLWLNTQHELAGALHEGWVRYPRRKWYGFVTDGCRMATDQWDKLLIAASGDRNIVSCNDGWRGSSRMCGPSVIPGWMLDALGWWFPPGLVHLYTDAAWEALGDALGNWVYVPDVHNEYRHFGRGDRNHEPADQATVRIFKGMPYAQRDGARFEEWRAKEMPAAVERVKAAWKRRTGTDWDATREAA